MDGALRGCRVIPGWVKPFLAAVRHGHNEKNAANIAGVGTAMIRQRIERDPGFKKEYEEVWATKRARPGPGPGSW